MKRTLRETLAPMTFKEKVDHIKEYYKIHIITSVVLIIIVAITIADLSRRQEVYLNIVLIGDTIHPAEVESVNERLNEDFLQQTKQKDEVIQLTSIPTTREGGDSLTSATIEKVTVQIAAGEVDFLVVDGTFLAELLEHQAISLLSFNSLDGVDLNEIGHHETIKEKNTSDIYGMSIKNMDIFSGYKFAEGKVICIPANTRNTKNIVELLQYMFEK